MNHIVRVPMITSANIKCTLKVVPIANAIDLINHLVYITKIGGKSISVTTPVMRMSTYNASNILNELKKAGYGVRFQSMTEEEGTNIVEVSYYISWPVA